MQNLLNSVGTEEASKVTDRIVAVATGLSGLTQELALIKARARLDAVTIPYVNLASDRALEIARANRYDWMNNRASLVDTWRLIAFNANALKAGLDLTFSGDLGTVGNNPAAFNGQNGSLRVGMRFDAPFTRRLERNAYRNALITYQQTRRSLYQYQDSVNFTLRSLIRQLEQLQINMEIQRRAVVIAIRRVDKTREDLNKPPAPSKPTTPGQPAEPVETLGPTVAVNLITALNDLQGAQNTFMSVVLNHYETRMLLYRELGIMELDDCGMWIDKPINEADWLTEEESPMPPRSPRNGWRMPASTCAPCTRARKRSLPTRRTAKPKSWPSEPPANRRGRQWRCERDSPWPWVKAIKTRRARLRTRAACGCGRAGVFQCPPLGEAKRRRRSRQTLRRLAGSRRS